MLLCALYAAGANCPDCGKLSELTSRLNLNFSSLSFFAFSSSACFLRATLRLWKPVRYSSRAAGSKSIFSSWTVLILRFLLGGGAFLIVSVEVISVSLVGGSVAAGAALLG